MVSSDMPEIIKIADRAYVMSEGTLTGELKGDEINELNLISRASPISSKEGKAGKSAEAH